MLDWIPSRWVIVVLWFIACIPMFIAAFGEERRFNAERAKDGKDASIQS